MSSDQANTPPVTSAPVQSQSAIPTSLRHPQQSSAKASSAEGFHTYAGPSNDVPQQEPEAQTLPPMYLPPTVNDLRYPTGPVRLIPTLPTNTSLAPSSQTPVSASASSPGRGSFLPAEFSTPSRSVSVGSPRVSTLGKHNSPGLNGALRGYKKCNKCNKDKVLSDYDYVDTTGRQQPRVQCIDCRVKRRESVARAKKKRNQARAKTLLQSENRGPPDQRQQQEVAGGIQGNFTLSHNPPFFYNPAMTAPGLAQDIESAAQGSFTPTPPGYSPMLPRSRLSENLQYGPPSSNGLARSLPTAQTLPVAKPTPPASNTPVVSSLPFPSTPIGPQTMEQMIESDISNFASISSSVMHSPSDFLSLEPGVDGEPLMVQQPEDQSRYSAVIVITLPDPRIEGNINQVLQFERKRFNDARSKCRWMKDQDDETLRRYWRRREASIVLGLSEVPPPEVQPYFTLTYAQGSHYDVHAQI